MYEHTRESSWKALAEKWQAGIEGQKHNTATHDLGFMIFDSFGNGYRLTKNDQYRKVLLTAAESLATRYNPNVGLTKSWDGPTASDFRVIIDNMMNLELLFWASKHGGSRTWYDMAVSHALHARRDFTRPDGSTYHLVNYDPKSGKVKHRGTHQGYSDRSTWSRGQAWAAYGFTMAYRETGDTRFLQTARETADYFLTHLPADQVPYWDLNLPSVKGEPRDTSAAAIASSGLLELSKLEPQAARSSRYFDRAKTILSSLSSPTYLAKGRNNQAVLLHGTQNKPANLFDTGLIFGDYYFLEALLKCSALTGRLPLPTNGASRI